MNRATPHRVLQLAVLAVLAALVGPLGACASGQQPPPPSHPSPLQARLVPDFSRATLAGTEIDTEKLRGQVVVVKFFAKYCEPCMATLPAAERLHQKYDDVTFVGVSVDERGADAEELVTRFGLSFPVVLDRGRSLSGRYRVVDIPMTFVIDRDGVVQWVAGPGQNEKDLQRAIESYR